MCRFPVLFTALFVSATLLTGCGSQFSQPAATTPGTAAVGAIKGKVHGGQQPVIGARVYLYAAGTGGNGGNGIAASTANASVSLLNDSVLINNPGSSGVDENLNYYVTTGLGGSFSITGDYSCTVGTQVYLYAVGGDPGGGINSAIGLLAGLGQCPESGSLAEAVPFVVVNEVTTVATAYALAGFATDATHISSDAGVSGNPTGPLAATGIANAMANVSNIVSIPSGVALTTTPAGNGTVPQSKIDTLANILAACVNSTGAGSDECTTLFKNATSDGTSSGSQPSDTATAAIYIAQHQGANVGNLYGLQAANVPFMPDLSSAPNDLTLSIQLTSQGFYYPGPIAIDGSGNAWIGNDGINAGLIELSSTGVVLSPNGGYTGGGLYGPQGIAIDGYGNVWVVNEEGRSFGTGISKFSSDGTARSPADGFTGGGLSYPSGIAIDGSDNVWVSNEGDTNLGGSTNSNLSKFSNVGVPLSGSNGFSGGGLAGNLATDLAIDGSGNVWTSDYFYPGALSKFSSPGVALSPANGYPGCAGGDDPLYLAVDASGSVLVSNIYDVTKFTNAGSLTANFGCNGSGTSYPKAVAVDGAGHAWFQDQADVDSIRGVDGSGAPLSGSGCGYVATSCIARNYSNPSYIAIDGSGNVWLPNFEDNYVVEFLGVAVPVVTPIRAGLPSTPTLDGSSKLGTRP